ncbi:hypothetical protein A2960_04190 [Candidatus Gottesmanbacteria bacterium RIFCSPLOWO2_01_FULL_39_12b]|uniref:Four helix bundle protein n=1 Tax=Candidatus Gottesmanbacteria bacterium RIFCSPLOWO2_01_FULL_39_12b TaxID=1798388 RepID=A0A1F6AS05_9BACT|nr:MAG: hypothetical protein A2960_04190 [Candidatus Gottesmanbacteria bacterium RIFCSPLOWO2_01_FULL_39_12b]
MSLPKYKYLLTYRYAEMIHDLTVEFCRKYIDYRSRTKDQMEQAARSGKQNIVEGVGQSQTSKKGEIKLLGVAKASFEELLTDFEDFLRQNKLEIWSKTDPKVLGLKVTAYRLSHLSNLSHLGHLKEKPILPANPEETANFLLTLCHLETYLLDKQIKSLEQRFVEEGGYTENLFKKRLNSRM